VDVELEQVEEFVGYEVDGAVYVFFDAEVEFEGASGFVADGEGYVLELAGSIGYLVEVLVHECLTLWCLRSPRLDVRVHPCRCMLR
jgi:hypothetical protein